MAYISRTTSELHMDCVLHNLCIIVDSKYLYVYMIKIFNYLEMPFYVSYCSVFYSISYVPHIYERDIVFKEYNTYY